MKVARYILLIVLASSLLAGVLWARSKASKEICKKVEVVVLNNDSTTFVTADGIMAEITRQNIKLEGLPMCDINTAQVEKILNSSPYLEDVECVKIQDGVLQIQVTQLLPVMRIFDGEDSYYVNSAGKHMKATADFFCDVPVVYGHFTKAYGPEKLLPMVQYVQNDSNLNAVVSMYQYKGPNDIYVIPCIAGHVVNMGSVDNYENKFKKLMLFYKKVMPQRGWDTFDTISVKWDHQVVATLRNHKVQAQLVDSTDYDLQEDHSWITNGLQEGTAATATTNATSATAGPAKATGSTATGPKKTTETATATGPKKATGTATATGPKKATGTATATGPKKATGTATATGPKKTGTATATGPKKTGTATTGAKKTTGTATTGAKKTAATAGPKKATGTATGPKKAASTTGAKKATATSAKKK